MSETRKAIAGVLTDHAIQTLTRLAKQNGEKPDAILREVRKGTPAGRLLLKLCGLGEPEVINGRPRDDIRFKSIYEVVARNKRLHGRHGIERARRELEAGAITGPNKRPLTSKRLREIYRDPARFWFEAPGDA